MSNLALAKAALKKSVDKRVTYKPNVLEAEAKGTASKQAYEAKTGDIDQLDLDYLDSLNRITGTLKNTYMESISANKITSGTMLATALTLAGTEASGNKTTLTMIGDALFNVNDGIQDTLRISNTGLELRDAGESTSAAGLVGRGISAIDTPGVRIWPIKNANRRGWQMRSDGVPGSLPQGYTRLIATRGSSNVPGDTTGWASVELSVEGIQPGNLTGFAGVAIRNMLSVLGPARISGSLEVNTGLKVSSSSDFDGAVFLNAGISRRAAANLQFNSGVDINSGDLRFTNTSVQGIRSIGGVPLDLYATSASIRAMNSFVATSGLIVQGATSLEGLSATGNVTLPADSINNFMLSSHATDNSKRSVGINHIFNALRSPGKGADGLRKIGGALGGVSTLASANDHGHSSGSTMNIDRIPVADRRRVLAYRKQLLEDMGNLRTLTVAELYTFVENLANVALDALSFAIDAPDIDADKRQALRDAGEYVSENWEFRETERREKSGSSEAGASMADEPDYFDTQPHYLGPTLPPSIRRPNRPDKPTKAKK